jgi:hypothetical protein
MNRIFYAEGVIVEYAVAIYTLRPRIWKIFHIRTIEWRIKHE